MRSDANLFKVIITSIAFLFLFSAFQTTSQTSENVLEAASQETEVNPGNGYISLSILYASFSICNWIAPLVIAFVGETYAMFAGSLCYLIFVSVFIEPRAWSVYLASVLTGFGAAILWTSQGAFLTKCSDQVTVNRNFSIFWIVSQCSQFVGGFYGYFFLAGVRHIGRSTRIRLFGGLLGCGAIGSLLFLTLRPPRSTSAVQNTSSESSQAQITDDSDKCDVQLTPGRPSCASLFHTFCRSFHLLRSKTLIGILLASGFTGVNNTLLSSLLASCIGHTKYFGSSAKSYMGLVLVVIGVGGLLGGALMNLRRWIASPGLVTVFGYATALLGVFLCFIMLPANSPMEETDAPTYVQTSIAAMLLAAALFGMVDAVWNTQIGVLIADAYRTKMEDVTTVFSLYRCVQSVLSAIAFGYCDRLLLQWQVLLYVIWATVGLAGFFYACWHHAIQSNTVIQADE